MLLLLLACAHHPRVDPAVLGEWNVTPTGPRDRDKFLLTLARGPDGVVADVRVDGQEFLGVPVFLGAPPYYTVKVDFPDRMTAYLSLRLVEADTLLAEVVAYQGQRRGSEVQAVVFRRNTPEAARQDAERAAALEAEKARTGVRDNLDSIKIAELSYDAAFDQFLSCPVPVPRPVESLTPEAVPWPELPKEHCFTFLGWRPDGPTRGTYAVELVNDERRFVAHAWEDPDGDGVPTHWLATAVENAHEVKP